ncbi:uncharacterized protein [Montipora foliosa]|uniref:uncharacterized protein n=1 Tax=Montipora foliosa TaxID=591990 RepID=UPI0035F111AC
MEALKVNKFGRTYRTGIALDQDMRSLIIDRILQEGGDRVTGYIPRSFRYFSEELKLSVNTITKIWRKFCEELSINPRAKGGTKWSKLTGDDLELIEILKIEKPSVSLAEIISCLEEMGSEEVSMATVSRALKHRLPSGPYTRKKITKIALERFTQTNIFYTQLFINYLATKNPRRLKFFDEAGVKLPDVGTRLYGHSSAGTRCVEVMKKAESPNTTLNMLVSLDGPEYYNLIDGATNTMQFLQFFEEAGNCVNLQTGRPCLQVGDIIVMDNLSAHHYEGGEILEVWLEEMGIELIYLPTYSPDLNPIEFCFNKVKTLLNGEFQELTHTNTKLAVMEAVERITTEDMAGFYEGTSYLFV